MTVELNPIAVRIAVKIVKQFEGFEGNSYPDPASELSIALAKAGNLKNFIEGKLELPPYLQKLSGNPWTCGFGETEGVTQGMTWTLEEATERLEVRVREFMQEVLKASPKLSKQAPERIAAVTSLCYNIGVAAYKNSTVAKKIAVDDHEGAADAILMWNKAGGRIMQGLVNRRKLERDLYISVRG